MGDWALHRLLRFLICAGGFSLILSGCGVQRSRPVTLSGKVPGMAVSPITHKRLALTGQVLEIRNIGGTVAKLVQWTNVAEGFGVWKSTGASTSYRPIFGASNVVLGRSGNPWWLASSQTGVVLHHATHHWSLAGRGSSAQLLAISSSRKIYTVVDSSKTRQWLVWNSGIIRTIPFPSALGRPTKIFATSHGIWVTSHEGRRLAVWNHGTFHQIKGIRGQVLALHSLFHGVGVLIARSGSWPHSANVLLILHTNGHLLRSWPLHLNYTLSSGQVWLGGALDFIQRGSRGIYLTFWDSVIHQGVLAELHEQSGRLAPVRHARFPISTASGFPIALPVAVLAHRIMAVGTGNGIGYYVANSADNHRIQSLMK